MGENPQYALTVTTTTEAPTVWLLLSRHIVTIEDFAENNEYITCHVFKGGNTVYYPEDAYKMGTKINSPHVLTKLHLEPGAHKFTVVISQHDKANTIRYGPGPACAALQFCSLISLFLAPPSSPPPPPPPIFWPYVVRGARCLHAYRPSHSHTRTQPPTSTTLFAALH